MLLTLAPPMQNDIKPPLEYNHSYKSHPSRYSPPESPRTLPSFFNDRESSMNNPHRGLPPPIGMSLPLPNERPSTSVQQQQSLGHLPAPPQQWAGQDESMRSWLHAKAEEDRRRQEEERTKQENLKLDQRKIEHDILTESLRGGVPAHMVPLIFAGIGGGNLPAHTLEWMQQYMSSLSIQNQQQQQQLQVQQQQMQQIQHQQSSPEQHMGSRGIPTNPYGPQASMQNTSNPQAQSSRNVIMAPQPSTNLSRLNTADLQPQPIPAQPARQSIQPAQQPPSESNSQLFFHHWVPPSNNQPPTPSGKSNQGSPYSQSAPSHLRSDYQYTPKKRKTTGGHVNTGPTSQPNDPSPPYSRSSRERETSPNPRSKSGTRYHSRQRSDASSKDLETRPIARPSSRQQRRDEISGVIHHEPRRQMTGGGMSSHGSSGDHEHDQHHHQMQYDGPKTEAR